MSLGQHQEIGFANDLRRKQDTSRMQAWLSGGLRLGFVTNIMITCIFVVAFYLKKTCKMVFKFSPYSYTPFSA
jgi:hypothetical protein